MSNDSNASSSQDIRVDAIAARVAASARDLTAEAQARVNQDEKRALRRIIYSGIERNNDAKLALESTKILQKLAKNILDHPGEEKYMQFKPTNTTVKRTLIEPKSTLEYAIAIGFRADVQNFQPLYIFSPTPKNVQSLRNGLECLDEYVAREEAKQANAKSAKETLKEAQARQRALVKLAYDDDRREKQLRDEMEKQRRDAVVLSHARAAEESPSQPEAELQEEGSDDPPPYNSALYSTLPLRGGDPTHGTDGGVESEYGSGNSSDAEDHMDEDGGEHTTSQ